MQEKEEGWLPPPTASDEKIFMIKSFHNYEASCCWCGAKEPTEWGVSLYRCSSLNPLAPASVCCIQQTGRRTRGE